MEITNFKSNIEETNVKETKNAVLVNKDVRDVVDHIEPHSIDLIITDPPYGTIKGINLNINTKWDTALEPEFFIDVATEKLRYRGRMALFSDSPYTNDLINASTSDIDYSYRYTYLKNDFGNPLVSKKAPVSITEDVLMFQKKHDATGHHPLRDYAKEVKAAIGKNLTNINHDIGGQRCSHFFTGGSQFSLCTRETYEDLKNEYNLKNIMGGDFRKYEDLNRVDENFKARNPSTFNLGDDKNCKTDVLEYAPPRHGHHPTAKPVDLLRDLIKTYTNPGDVVLDLTAGSGSTIVAAVKDNRRAIGVEKDPDYYDVMINRVTDIIN